MFLTPARQSELVVTMADAPGGGNIAVTNEEEPHVRRVHEVAVLDAGIVLSPAPNLLKGPERIAPEEFSRVVNDLRAASAAAAAASPELSIKMSDRPETLPSAEQQPLASNPVPVEQLCQDAPAKRSERLGGPNATVERGVCSGFTEEVTFSREGRGNYRANAVELEIESASADASSSSSYSSSSSSDSSTSSSSSSEVISDSDDDEPPSGSGSDAESETSSSEGDSDPDHPQRGGREEQEAYRKFSLDKELFHLIHKISNDDPTATSLSLLPEADRVLASCDWDTSTLLSHKHSHRPLTRRELLAHVARQMESRQPQFGVPTGAQLIQEVLAKPPLFLKELQIYSPLIANRLSEGDGGGSLARFLSTSTNLKDFTLFHISTGGGVGDNNPPHNRVIPSLIAAVAESSSIQKLALRKLILPPDTDCARLLRDTSSLIQLELAYCVLQPDLGQSLKTGLLQNSTLQKLTILKELNDPSPSLVPVWEGLVSHSSLRELSTEMMSCQQSELNSLGMCVASAPCLESLSLIVASNKNTPVSQRRANYYLNSLNEALFPRATILSEARAALNNGHYVEDNNSTGVNSGSQTSTDAQARRHSEVQKLELNASPFFRALVASKSLRKLRLHPYVALQDEDRVWTSVLDESNIESFDLGQGLSSQANPGLVSGVMESLLGQNPKLRHMNLSNVYCHGVLSLRQVMAANLNLSLSKLSLRNCRLMDSDMEALASGLRQFTNNSLKELDLGSNYIGFHGFECLSRSIAECKNAVESLDLSFNSFGDFSCVKSFSLLLRSKVLKYLDVSCTDMFTEPSSASGYRAPINQATLLDMVELLRKSLAENKSLVRLAADDNGFSDPLAIALFIGIRDNKHLKELSLDGNSLQLATPECRQSLVEMLVKNKTLTCLNLPRNRGMTDAGFRSLTSGIKRNKTLEHIAVRVVCAEALPKLQNALLASRSLVKLTVSLPSAPDRVQAENRILSLIKCVGRVKTFQCLFINGEQHLISPSTGRLLLDILRKNPSFHSFNLSLALCPCQLRTMIEFFVELNKRGRRFLDLSLQQPVGVWPHILAPLAQSNSGYTMYLYFFIREHIALHQRTS